GLPVPSLPVIGGDAAAACIAAASVLAKVSRDRLMVAMDADHPGYGFADHKGYSTLAHSAALNELGPCSQHRYSFINVRRVAAGSGSRLVVDCEPNAPGERGTNGWGKMEPDSSEGAVSGSWNALGDDADRLRSEEEPGNWNRVGRLSR
ncbi:MAG: hypothetical protein JOZ00_07915, partial [Mycobacterium sp.]|nr:hypothetical protein [Mycobacterium sp.]